MFIHTVTPSETLYHIARKYGVAPTKIIEANGLENPDRLSVGDKLVIITPTRTYTVRGGDTLEKISRRFGIPIKEILKNNPSLMGGDKIYPEELLTLKQDAPRHGSALINGYYYRGCPGERLALALPYMNYVTVATAAPKRDGEVTVSGDKEVLSAVSGTGCAPLLRYYDRRGASELSEIWDTLSHSLIKAARERGYRGITLALYSAMGDAKISELILKLRHSALLEGLLLLLELDGNKKITVPDIADGYVLQYEKCALGEIPTFESGERAIYTDFAERYDAAKTFIDLSPYAYSDSGAMTLSEARELAYRSGKEIGHDGERLISYFDIKKYGQNKGERERVRFESSENIKAKLTLLGELGYMGISFDIMRSPITHLVMTSSLFSPAIDYLGI